VFKDKKILNFYFYYTIYFLGQSVFWYFYSIFLYKQTSSFKLVVLEQLIFYIAVFFGFVAGSKLLIRYGYFKAIRVSLLPSILINLVLAFMLGDVIKYYVVIALVRGFIEGIIWPAFNTFIIKEIETEKRSTILYSYFGWSTILTVLAPVAFGGFIDLSSGYKYPFLICAFIFGICFLVFLKFVGMYAQKEFSFAKIKNIYNAITRKQYFLISILMQTGLTASDIIFSIIPFVLIGSEFGVGVYAGLLSLVSGIVSFSLRNVNFKTKLKLAVIAAVFQLFGDIGFVIYWTLTILVVRNLIRTLLSSLTSPFKDDLYARNTEFVLDDKIHDHSLELMVLNDFLYLIGRIIACGILIFVISYFSLEILSRLSEIFRLLLFLKFS
jgi:MFS family permease